MRTAPTGRTHGCTDQCCKRKKVLANWEPSTHGTKRTCRPRCATSAFRGKAENICSQGAFPVLTARCIQATPFGKIDEPAVCAIARSCLDPKNQPVACLVVQHGSGGAFGGDGIMNPRRFTTVAPAFCGSLVLAGVIVGWLAGFGSAGTENTGAVPIENRAASLAANAKHADEPQAIAMGNAAVADAAVADAAVADAAVANAAVANAAVADAPVASAEVATAAEPVTGAATDTTAASDKPELIVVAALPDPSQTLPADLPPVHVATANTSDLVPNDVTDAVSRIEIQDECLVAETCIDRFLWALYERTPKLDMIKVQERRKVTVKKRGKTKTVTKTFTRLVDNDFTWKDPKAADKVGMTMMDYVIGGMDRSFKLKLFYTLYAAEQAGLSPGITSAFRDDYRQSIASGLKAASDRSYHGGSSRGGYGHGLAADVVSVKGATRAQRWISTESFWKWIDAHGNGFGIGRPYLDRDPPHVAPTDGKEYASHRGGTKAQHAESDVRKRNRLAVRDHHRVMRTASADRRKA